MSESAVAESAVQELDGSFRGELIRHGDAGYDAARAIFNAMIDRRPALIARCTGVADILAALEFARSQELQVAVRSGGHGVAGNAICDDGIVIDLSPMRGVRVDPERGTARANGGALWGEFDRETQAFGLATPGGRVSTTGVAGLTLGSGSSWLERKHGLTVDNLLSVDVVTADGRLLTASEDENEELFWGLRGGSGNFGIATSFEFRLHPVGPMVVGGFLLHRAERGPDGLRFYRDFIAEAPDDVGGAPAFLTAPPAPFVPQHLHGAPMFGFIVCYFGPPEEAEEALRPLREFGPPEIDLVQPMPYIALQSMIDDANPPGLHNYWKAEFLQELSDDAIETIAEHAARVTSPLSLVVLEPKGGAITRRPEDATPLGRREAPFAYYAIGMWDNPGESDRHVAWAREFGEAMEPYTTAGIYLNFTSETGEGRVRSTYGPEKYDRLVALKDEYDPTNFFRFNQNIKPSGAA
jgi:FAD binding domain-containing protein/berberine-like enzyme